MQSIINNIYIDDFRVLKEFNLTFNEKITILIGSNGSGKTSILEFINDIENINTNSYININMSQFNSKTSKEKIKNIKNKIVYIDSSNDKIEDIKKIFFAYLQKKITSDSTIEDLILQLKEMINSILNELNINFLLDEIDINKKMINFYNVKNGAKFSIEYLSSGEKTLLSKIVLLYLLDQKNSIILIDEPEISLHPSWQCKLVHLYKKIAEDFDSQVIIATHSLYMTSKVKNDSLKVLKLSEDGNVECINPLAYGRDIDWILQNVMEVDKNCKREDIVNEKFQQCRIFIEDDNIDEAGKCLDELEVLIGDYDDDIVSLRADIEFWRD